MELNNILHETTFPVKIKNDIHKSRKKNLYYLCKQQQMKERTN
jgi:hypothetical protein